MPIVGPQAELFTPGEPLATRVGYAGMGMGGYTQEEVPLAYSMLDSLPSVSTTMAWNLGRTRNTIIDGGGGLSRKSQFYKPNSGMGTTFSLRGGVGQTLRPRNFRRAANIDPSFYGGKSGIYSPFGSLSGIGNAMFGRVENRIKHEPTAKRVAAMVGSAPRSDKEAMFSSGTMGRVMAMHDIGNLSHRQLNKKAGNIFAAIQDINPKFYADSFHPGYGKVAGMGDDAIKAYMRAGMGETITSRISGRFAGHVEGMVHGYKGGAAADAFRAGLNESSHFGQAAKAAMEKASAGNLSKMDNFIAKGGVGKVAKGANIAGWVLLAHDLARMGGKLVGAGLKGAVDAGKSAMGSIDKGVMGMGFKDNTVAATSRQRGVMAIANSRLNMRSLLGNESSMMAAHFG